MNYLLCSLKLGLPTMLIGISLSFAALAQARSEPWPGANEGLPKPNCQIDLAVLGKGKNPDVDVVAETLQNQGCHKGSRIVLTDILGTIYQGDYYRSIMCDSILPFYNSTRSKEHQEVGCSYNGTDGKPH